MFVVALAVAGGFAYWYGFRGGENQPPVVITPPPPPDGVNPPPGNIASQPKDKLPPFPKNYKIIRYDQKVTAEISAEVRKKQEDAFKAVLADIERNPDTPSVWIELGNIKKFFGDYQGAIAAWRYVILIRPKHSTSYNNLGDLYWHYLRDFPKAEESYRKAIENFSDNLGLYKDLSDLYRYDYKEKAHLADDILLDALKVQPKSVTALAWLGGYYRDTGNKEKAREYFGRALEIDPANAQIKAELEALAGM